MLPSQTYDLHTHPVTPDQQKMKANLDLHARMLRFACKNLDSFYWDLRNEGLTRSQTDNFLDEMAVEVVDEETANTMSELRQWYDHDRREQSAEQELLRTEALKKLSPAERKALGLK